MPPSSTKHSPRTAQNAAAIDPAGTIVAFDGEDAHRRVWYVADRTRFTEAPFGSGPAVADPGSASRLCP